MVTNASVGVGVNGHISKIIAVNPAGNKRKLYPEDLQTPLNRAISEYFMAAEEVVVQVFIITKHHQVELFFNRTKSCFDTRFSSCNFKLRHQQIISLTAQGYEVEEIASLLQRSKSLITKYRQEIYDVLEMQYDKPRKTSSIKWYAREAGLG